MLFAPSGSEETSITTFFIPFAVSLKSTEVVASPLSVTTVTLFSNDAPVDLPSTEIPSARYLTVAVGKLRNVVNVSLVALAP